MVPGPIYIIAACVVPILLLNRMSVVDGRREEVRLATEDHEKDLAVLAGLMI